MKQELTEEQEAKRGELLAEILNLRTIREKGWDSDRFRTEWGTKSALGLFRIAKRIVEEGE